VLPPNASRGIGLMSEEGTSRTCLIIHA